MFIPWELLFTVLCFGWVEHYQPDIPITVNTTHPILIQLFPSVVEPLMDCPGLKDKLHLQPCGSNKCPSWNRSSLPTQEDSAPCWGKWYHSAKISNTQKLKISLNFRAHWKLLDIHPIVTTQSQITEIQGQILPCTFPLNLPAKQDQ